MPDTAHISPDFTWPRANDARGVRFFHRRDDTPVRTAESIGFSVARPEFASAGARVLDASAGAVPAAERGR